MLYKTVKKAALCSPLTSHFTFTKSTNGNIFSVVECTKAKSPNVLNITNHLITVRMLNPIILVSLVVLVSTGCFADVSHLLGGRENYQLTETTTYPSPPVPYSFHYKAGRFPGTIDRFQSESGDGTGAVRGKII